MTLADNTNTEVGVSAVFVAVEVENGPASPDGVSLRFQQYGPAHDVGTVPYVSAEGLEGFWQVRSVDDVADRVGRAAVASLVEDSNDGLVWLVTGGRQGLLLRHPSGVLVREPFLMLSQSALSF